MARRDRTTTVVLTCPTSTHLLRAGRFNPGERCAVNSGRSKGKSAYTIAPATSLSYRGGCKVRFWRLRKRGTPKSHPVYDVRNRESIILKPTFVETIPSLPEMEKGKIYVSMRFATLSHLCPCGCGRLVDVTLDPTRRSLTYDGEFLTLRPSIGVRFPCRSHYSIIRNAIKWYPPISKSEGRWYDRVRERWS